MPPLAEDDLFADAVQAVQRVAGQCGISVLLVGAYARDLLLKGLGVGSTLRRTRDVDFGVKVENWEDFQRLRATLLASGEFQPVDGGKSPHKMNFRGQMEVDLVPFGGVASADGRLSCWPDDFQQEMNVLGYKEAMDQAERCPIGAGEGHMVSLGALVGLKILSWNDSPSRRGKDAVDLALVLKNLGFMTSVLEEIHSLEDNELEDLDRRCHRWMGRKMASVFEPPSLVALKDILDRETDDERGWQMARQMRGVFRNLEDALGALSDLRDGLIAWANEGRTRS